MDRRFHTYRSKTNPIFLVVDEFAALRISMDKKEFNEINEVWKRIIFDGTVCERSFINNIAKEQETSVIDGAIR